MDFIIFALLMGLILFNLLAILTALNKCMCTKQSLSKVFKNIQKNTDNITIGGILAGILFLPAILVLASITIFWKICQIKIITKESSGDNLYGGGKE